MELRQAFELGHQTAACGFFFDGMEVIAAAVPVAGSLDPLKGAVACVSAEGRDAHERMQEVCGLLAGATGHPVDLPRGVDDYRRLLTEGVFDVVNRWSLLRDIRQVTRLQAWFYAGFGLGRARSVLLALPLLDALRAVVGAREPVASMPGELQRLLAEAIKQMEVAAAEADLDAVRPLFVALAQALKPVCVRLQAPASDVALRPDDAALVDECRGVASAVRGRLVTQGSRVPS